MNTPVSRIQAAPPKSRHWNWPARLAFGGFALIALFFLLTEHRAHLLGTLPFVLLAACPLLHFMHHRGHGGHGGGSAAGNGGQMPPPDAKSHHP